MKKIEIKRLAIFLAFAFGIAWLGSLVIYLTGGLQNSPMIVPALNLTLAAILMAVVLMGAPAVANLLTRLLTHEGKENLLLKPGRNEKAFLYWWLGWFGPAIFTVLGAIVFFLLFPRFYDSSFEAIQNILNQQAASGKQVALSPAAIVFVSTLQSIILAPILNGLFTFGEEFGWRGYLLPKLMPLGGRKAVFISGLIWGIWHAPVIAMGHNFGLDYPGYPWLGILMMIVFCVAFGTFLSWMTLKEGSIWPAVIGHAAGNGIAALGLMVIKGTPNMVLGPTPVGIVGGVFLEVLAIVLFIKQGALTPGREKMRWKSEPIAMEDNTGSSD